MSQKTESNNCFIFFYSNFFSKKITLTVLLGEVQFKICEPRLEKDFNTCHIFLFSSGSSSFYTKAPGLN